MSGEETEPVEGTEPASGEVGGVNVEDNAGESGKDDAATVPGKASEPETSEDDKDAQIAELRKQLEDAQPILQAHAEAEEQNKTDLQKANERAEGLEAELTRLRDEAARARVAEKTGLSSDVVALLNGSTEEEILKAAEKVVKARPRLHSRSEPVTGAGPSKGSPTENKPSPSKLADAIRKRMPY